MNVSEDAIFSEKRLLNSVFFNSGELHAYYEPVDRIPKYLTVVIEHPFPAKYKVKLEKPETPCSQTNDQRRSVV